MLCPPFTTTWLTSVHQCFSQIHFDRKPHDPLLTLRLFPTWSSPFVLTFGFIHLHFFTPPHPDSDRISCLLRNVQTCSRAHPSYYTMDTAVPSRGVKRSKRDVNSPPSSVEVKNEWSYISTPPIYLRYVHEKKYSTFYFPACCSRNYNNMGMSVLFGNSAKGCSGGQYVTVRQKTKFSAMTFPRLCPITVLEKVCWRQGRALEKEEHQVMRNRLLRLCSRGNKFNIRALFCGWRGSVWRHFDNTIGGGSNVDFVYQLSTIVSKYRIQKSSSYRTENTLCITLTF